MGRAQARTGRRARRGESQSSSSVGEEFGDDDRLGVKFSLVAETSEFFASTGNSAFWRFVDSLLNDVNQNLRTDSDDALPPMPSTETELDTALTHAGALLAPHDGGLALLRFALALRFHSPHVHLHRQIARYMLRRGTPEGLPAQFKHFFELNGAVGFEVAQLNALSTAALLEAAKQRSPSVVYSVGHIYPSVGPPAGASIADDDVVVAVLYADIGAFDDKFRALHERFVHLAMGEQLIYVLRHFDNNDQAEENFLDTVSLSGYGVELAIKSTEYKAIDDSNEQKMEEASHDVHGFNFSRLREKYEHLRDNLRQFQLHLVELDDLSPLKQWEIADIDIQAAQRVMDATPEEALGQLADLSQNFPIRARSLVRTKVRQSFRDEVAQNQKRWAEGLELSKGESALFLNGIPIAMGEDVERLDMFQLFDTLRQEQQLAHAFAQMGLGRDYQPILHLMDLSEEKPGGYALDYREANPDWLNNLGKDKVCLMDPATPVSWPLIRSAYSLFVHQVPLRIGFVFVLTNSASSNGFLGNAIHNVYQFVKTEDGLAKAVLFLKKMFGELATGTSASTDSTASAAPASGDDVTLDTVHAYFKRHYTDQEVVEVFGPDSEYTGGSSRSDGIAFFRRSGLQRLPVLLVNGVPIDNSLLQSDDRVEEGILVSMMRQTASLQRAVLTGKLTDKENVQNWVMSQPDVLPRLNSRLLGAGAGTSSSSVGLPKGSKATNSAGGNVAPPPFYTTMDCSSENGEDETDGGTASASTATERRTACVLNTLRYLRRADESASESIAAADVSCWLTMWTVGDPDTADGRKLLSNALKGLKKSNVMRMAVLYNGKNDSKSVSVLVDALLHGLSSIAAKQSLNKLLASDELIAEVKKNGAESALDRVGGHGVNLDPVRTEMKNAETRLRIQAEFARVDLGLVTGQRVVLVNGQFYGPFVADEQLEPEDFGLFERLAEKRGAKAVAALVNQGGRLAKFDSKDTVFRILAAVNGHAVSRRRQNVNNEVEYESALTLLANLEDERRPVLEFTAAVAPLSRAAQKLAPVLRTLLEVVNADLRLAMNPKQRLSELPLKRFYRYVLQAEPTFGATGSVAPNVAQFRELPQKQLLTLNLIVPGAWMVQPVRAEHDLDNIRVASAAKDIVAYFQLRHILLEGHCFEDQLRTRRWLMRRNCR